VPLENKDGQPSVRGLRPFCRRRALRGAMGQSGPPLPRGLSASEPSGRGRCEAGTEAPQRWRARCAVKNSRFGALSGAGEWENRGGDRRALGISAPCGGMGQKQRTAVLSFCPTFAHLLVAFE